MAEPDHILDTDFDSQLRGLFEQAEQAMTKKPSAGKAEEEVTPAIVTPVAKAVEEKPSLEGQKTELPKASTLSLPQMLRPVVLGLEAVTRAAGENMTVLTRIEKATVETVEAQHDLPKIVSDLRALLETRNGVSQGMFKALHEELKGYKDGFLLEAVQRPIIRDMITLYDDLSEILRQVSSAIAEQVDAADVAPAAVMLIERMKTTETNIAHNLEFILEILARLEVTQLPVGTGKLDKRTQRVVAVELTDNQEDGQGRVRSVRRGFMWKDRIVRAEEVVISKWKESASEQ